jgi:hypothetical protein
MHLVNDTAVDRSLRPLPVRRESAALHLLASGGLGAHLLRLAEAAAAEHLAHMAQEESQTEHDADREMRP